MRRFACAVASFALVLGAAAPAAAQNVSDYNAYKVQHYVQSAATPPASAGLFYCNFGFDVLVASAFTTGTVSWSTPTAYSPAPLTLSGTGGSGSNMVWFYWWPGPEETTKAALDADCPSTAYTYAVSGGALGSVSGTLNLPADAYSSATPAVDAATFARLLTYDPSSTVTLSTVAHPAGNGTQFSATIFSLSDTVSNTTVFSVTGTDGGAVSVQVDGGSLEPGHAYQASVDFTDRVVVDNAGFGTATAFTAFEQTTAVDFQTLAADASLPVEAGGVEDAGAPSDASGPSDAAIPVDSSSAFADAESAADSGGEPDSSFTVNADAGLVASTPNNGSKSCSCRAAGGARGADVPGGAMLLGLGVAAALRRGQRRRCPA
jgi:hypothetical protein